MITKVYSNPSKLEYKEKYPFFTNIINIIINKRKYQLINYKFHIILCLFQYKYEIISINSTSSFQLYICLNKHLSINQLKEYSHILFINFYKN